MEHLIDDLIKSKICHKKKINKKLVIKFLKEVRKIIFLGYFEEINIDCKTYVTTKITKLKTMLKELLVATYTDMLSDLQIDELCTKIIINLGTIKKLLEQDVEAAMHADPAADDTDEIILSYPGIYAIFIYRLANMLYNLQIPKIPRIMSEYAHSRTGIDIHPGATIGESFFIDHGTGIVIGETTIIGNNVKIYQSVTLGAISLTEGHKMKGTKRHPTIEDDVTIYSGATILGGNTVIGQNSIIGGNVFITKSIEPNKKVYLKNSQTNVTSNI